ncbi:MAG: nuclease domain-containing protein, partial [Thermomicrobiales bacterium]
YNLGKRGYSGIWLRPDYWWQPIDGRPVAFDAKFRMSRFSVTMEGGVESELNDVPYNAKVDDLVKMHAYRDALDVRAAIVIFPGTESKWLPSEHVPDLAWEETGMLASLLMNDELEGVGAIAMSPVTNRGFDR